LPLGREARAHGPARGGERAESLVYLRKLVVNWVNDPARRDRASRLWRGVSRAAARKIINRAILAASEGLQNIDSDGAASGLRPLDLLIHRQALYQAEL